MALMMMLIAKKNCYFSPGGGNYVSFDKLKASLAVGELEGSVSPCLEFEPK